MTGQVTNLNKFMANIQNALERPLPEKVVKPEWSVEPQAKTLTDLSQDQLVDHLEKECANIHTAFYKTTTHQLNDILKEVILQFGGSPVIRFDDPRFEQYQVAFNDFETTIWDETQPEASKKAAESAQVGVTFSDYCLSESGTIVLYSGKGRGRAVSLMPETYVALIPKSTIVPRFTQAAEGLYDKNQTYSRFPSCVNFITGPSNSADIEMNLVVGVHGPVKAAYIVIEDI
ncbi:Lactate utilization protein C [Staphylococcus piscifermentans]|uniref:Lactate utilization protein C n=1 Tax=Staphylococcus piscifermentans TaxID=70258 RepID=A0A239TSQ4_9STAP|nr:lactate utilization protein C [Staphylococcus piscifermentans]RTX82990.1 lactate utilization protein C [Staphylococcus piscifermentans]GEP84918.1 lactate utilization protein C [Staphylococcus piscifermentans]SNV00696.1 Lactate utilization protein C [Staphylococcus piscifermentans]